MIRLSWLMWLMSSACTTPSFRIPVDVGGEAQVLPEFPRVQCGAADLPETDRVSAGTPMRADIAAQVNALELPTAQALLTRDEGEVARTQCALRSALSRWRGVPDTVANYKAVVHDSLTTEIELSVTTQWLQAMVAQEPWPAPTSSGVDVSTPLRTRCERLRVEALGTVLFPELKPTIRPWVQQGLQWLLAVQRPDGLFPFPDLEDEFAAKQAECSQKAGADLEQFQRELKADPARLVGRAKADLRERGERVEDYFVDGWLVRDVGALGNNGGLQYDNGVCGEAALIAGLALDDASVVGAARKAANWAERQPLATNWNYNAFSVRLMALMALVDNDTRLGSAAVDRAWWGVLPGQLANGRWSDGHNARVVYHVILLNALGPLLPFAKDRSVAVQSALTAALESYASEIRLAQGTAGDDRAMMTLLEATASRALTPQEASTLKTLRSGSASASGVRNASLVDALLAERGGHPIWNRLAAALKP
jgi:hypothetical protein